MSGNLNHYVSQYWHREMMWSWISTCPLPQTPYGSAMILYRESARLRGELSAASNALRISDDTVLGVGEVAQVGEGKTS